ARRPASGAAPAGGPESARRARAAVWAVGVGVPAGRPGGNFVVLGGAAIRSVRVVAAARRRGVELTPQQVFRYQTLAELADASSGGAEPVANRPAPAAGLEPVSGPDTAPAAAGAGPAGESPLAACRRLAAAEIVDAYPLAPLQDHMLDRFRVDDEPGLYLVQRIFRLTGTVDVPALARSWDRLLDRHAALRTAFRWSGLARPAQVVLARSPERLRVSDLTALPAAEGTRRLTRYVEEDRRQRWEPTHPTPIRMHVFLLPGDDVRVVLTFNYMLVDGWSLGLLMRELFADYRALREGRDPEPVPVVPYRRVVDWIDAQPLGPAEGFWRDRLAGAGPTRVVAATGGSAGRPDGAGADPSRDGFVRQHTLLDADLTERLARAARAHAVTPSTVVQSGWALMLARLTGEHDVVFGATSSGRAVPVADVDAVVGPCINTLPVRIRVAGERPLAGWLTEVQRRQQQAQAHEHVSLRALRHWLDPAGRPLFDHYLVFQNLGELMVVDELPGLRLRDEVPQFFTKMEYPLRVDFFPGPRLGVFLSYHQRYLADQTVRDLLSAFTTSLAALCAADPAAPVGDVLAGSAR
ncbi:condensation domain-containing protein, partial [Micromonosporaceae bacterium B7E4]